MYLDFLKQWTVLSKYDSRDIKISTGIWVEILIFMFSDRNVVIDWLDFIPDSVKISLYIYI